MTGFFIRFEKDDGLLESRLVERGASSVRKYELVHRFYAVLTDDAALELSKLGYFVEPERKFKALYQAPSQQS